MGAAKDLAAHPDQDPQSLLDKLQNEEDGSYALLQRAEVPTLAHNNYVLGYSKTKTTPTDDDKMKLDAPNVFIKGPALCHTARLPAQSRFLGHLTDSAPGKVGGVSIFGNETYDVGIEDQVAMTTPSNGNMRLVWTMHNERVAAEACARDGGMINPDYYDFFLTGSLDGWNKLIFPNEAEKKAYNYDPANIKGYVVLYPMKMAKAYYTGKDQLAGLADVEFREKKWEMKINGQPVTELINLNLGTGGAPCLLASGPNNNLVFAPPPSGSYTIEIKVNEKDSYVRLRTIVLY
jgi:hypothetical protein